MSISEKLTIIAENEPKVHEAGRKQALLEAWSGIQMQGTRTDYTSYFRYSEWDDTTFNPQYDMNLTNGYYMFPYSKITDLCAILERNGVVLDTSGMTAANGFQYMFYNTSFKILPDIVVPENILNLPQTFGLSYNLHTIKRLTVHENLNYAKNDTFAKLVALENLTIKGTIGQNNFNVQWSTKLSHESLMSIINALKDYSEDTSGTQWVVTIGEENIAKLTAEELAIAEDKGWEVA